MHIGTKQLRNTVGILAAGALLGTAGAAPTAKTAPTTQHVMTTPADVKWQPGPPGFPPGSQFTVVQGDPSASGKLFTIWAKLPPNYRVAPHTHPTDEHVTVLSGELHMGMGPKADASAGHALPAGSFAVMPAKTAHYAFTTDAPVTIQVHAMGPFAMTYINPADDPRSQATGTGQK